ncbi:S-layer homology domain-containing protein [Thermotoga sp. SG1]|uniref:S-layer homology domain-containing protein n=1 Tax=Thermotoga sp. SG1 TaxID=126739 RepID=UPI001E525911|nr:S-layer homology domain-containing protein [Thermotoga sp. SG1]
MLKRIFLAGLLIIALSLAGQDIKDVEPDSPFFEAVKYVVDSKLMELDENGNFRGALLVTRYDIAQYIYRLVMRFELEKLREKISLLDELDIIKAATIALDERTKKLEEDYKLMDTRIEDVMSRITSSASDLSELEVKVNSLEDAYRNLSLAFASFKQETGGFDTEILRRIDTVEKRLQELEKISGEHFSRLGVIEDSLKRAETMLSNLEETVTKLGTETQNLLAWKKDAGGDILLLKGKVESLTKHLNETTENVKSLSSDLVKLREVLLQNISDVSGRTSSLEAKLADLENEISQASERILDLESKLATVEKGLETLSSRTSNLEKAQVEYQMAESSLEREVKDLKQQVAALSDRLQSVSSDVRTLTQKLAEEEKKTQEIPVNTNLLMMIGVGALAIVLGILLLSR